jgi:hypothetical protein
MPSGASLAESAPSAKEKIMGFSSIEEEEEETAEEEVKDELKAWLEPAEETLEAAEDESELLERKEESEANIEEDEDETETEWHPANEEAVKAAIKDGKTSLLCFIFSSSASNCSDEHALIF